MAKEPAASKRWPIETLWKQYEGIAMHFNDLLIRLRTQALAGVAALSALAGIFARTAGDDRSWAICALVFFILAIAWIAIWILDFRYYNRLLLGAVSALLELEKLSTQQKYVDRIDVSTRIEMAVAGELPSGSCRRTWQLSKGRWLFYSLVLVALCVGLAVSLYYAGSEFRA